MPILSLDLLEYSFHDKRPSFFADVHRHIEFIKCVIDEKHERDCQYIQDTYDTFIETIKSTTTKPVDTFNKRCGKKERFNISLLLILLSLNCS